MLTALRELIPKSIRVFLYKKYENIRLYRLKKRILRYYAKRENISDNEIKSALAFLKNNKLEVLPYNFIKEYNDLSIIVHLDTSCNLPYVVHNNNKIYFRRDWNKIRIASYFRGILAEQDSRSAHCYLTNNFEVIPGSNVYDIGVAEGNFSLSIVDKAKSIHLFEADEAWIEVLNKTFEPWKDKVHIHQKFVTNSDKLGLISLDTFAKEHPVDFIKVDVDGGERNLLEGAANLLKGKNSLKVALCTYHKQGDAEEFNKKMKANGFNTELSNSYMLFHYDKLTPPFFRKGVLKAWK